MLVSYSAPSKKSSLTRIQELKTSTCFQSLKLLPRRASATRRDMIRWLILAAAVGARLGGAPNAAVTPKRVADEKRVGAHGRADDWTDERTIEPTGAHGRADDWIDEQYHRADRGADGRAYA